MQPEPFAGRLFDFIVRFRVWVLLCAVALAGYLASNASSESDSSLEIWFLDDDPDVRAYEDFLERFETDEFVAVAIEVDDVFDWAVLQDVHALTEALAEVEGVTRAVSLSNVESIETTLEDGVHTIRTTHLFEGMPLAEAHPADSSGLEELRQQVHGDSLLAGLVSSDDSAALILVNITHFDDLAPKMATGRGIVATCERVLPHRTVHVSGSAVLDDATNRYTQRDMEIFAPLTLLVVCVVSFLLFRSLVATGLIVAVVAMTMVSTTGLAGLFGVRLNVITVVIIPLVLSVGTAGCVHIIAGYRVRLQRGLEAPEALRSAFIELLLPCTMTALTTAAGLGSLLATTLEPLRQFGWMGASAVLFALFYTLTVLPAAYSFLKPPRIDQKYERRVLTRVLVWLARLSWKRDVLIVVGSLLICAVALVGVFQVETGADFQRFYHEDDPVLIAANFIDQHMGGTLTLEVLVEADDVREPAVLQSMQDVENFMSQFSSVGEITSPATLTRILNERYTGNPDAGLPGSLPASAQLLELIIGTDLLATYLSTDNRAGRVSIRINATEYKELADRSEEIEQTVEGTFGAGVVARSTGLGKLFFNLDTYILVSQIRSITIAFVIIAAMICLMFWSLRFGLFALIPNAMPLLLVLGTMGWFGFFLDVATVMIASILLGLIVDDTIHFMARFRLEERRALAEGRTGYLREALRVSGVDTGRASMTTTVVLALAFFTLLLASFRVNQTFGFLAGIAVIIALLCDLVVLPASIRMVERMRIRPD